MRLTSNIFSACIKALFLAAIFIALLATMAIWRYKSWMPSVFFGDDLSNYISFLDGYFASTSFQALTAVFSEKYRPIFALVIGGLFGLFGQQIDLYLIVNILLHVISALIVFAIALQLSRGNILVAFMSAILTVTTRFALYQVTQVTGLLEGVGLVIFLTMIYFLIRFEQEHEQANLRPIFFAYSAILVELLLVHTHERYVALVPWVACSFLLMPKYKWISGIQRQFIIVLAIVPAIATVFYKKIVLHSAFFVGTGGYQIQIDPHGMQIRLVEGILSLFGFNYGPEYLVGRSIAAHPETFGWQMALLFTVGWMIILVMALRNTWLKAPNSDVIRNLRLPFMFFCLIGLLMLPPIMTIRMEQRWLVQPFLILLMIAAWSIGALENRAKQLSVVVFAALTIASFAVDSYISKSFSSIFFVYSAKVADVIKRDVVDADPHGQGPLIFVAGADICKWVLINGEFFRLYGGRMRPVECIENISQLLKEESKLGGNIRVFSIDSAKGAFDITEQLLSRRSEYGEIMKFDFLALFEKGHISDDRYVDTPSGKGALILPLNTRLGVDNTLTVLSGFSYAYDNVMIGQSPVMRFDVGMVYPVAEPARAVVKVIGGDGIVDIVYSMLLPIQPKMDGINLLPISISLARYSGRKVSVVFNVETPGNDTSGHWVAFGKPRIVLGGQPDDEVVN